jgi:hypothetical protein
VTGDWRNRLMRSFIICSLPKMLFIALAFFKVHVRTFGRLTHGRFLNLFRHSVGLLWTSDRTVAKASIHTGQDNTESRDKHPCLKRDSNPRSQHPRTQGLCFRPRGHWDRPLYNYSHKCFHKYYVRYSYSN